MISFQTTLQICHLKVSIYVLRKAITNFIDCQGAEERLCSNTLVDIHLFVVCIDLRHDEPENGEKKRSYIYFLQSDPRIKLMLIESPLRDGVLWLKFNASITVTNETSTTNYVESWIW